MNESDPELRDAIAHVVDYMWASEERDFFEHRLADREGHIFNDLCLLQDRLNSSNSNAGEPIVATDNVTYHPISGGLRAERAAGFALKDGELTVDTFTTETEAWKAAAEIAGQPGREEIDVTPIEASTEFIYLNPSTETDDGVPNVFLYQGANGDPALDEPLMHFIVFDHHCSECGLHRDDGHMPGCSKGAM